MKRLYQITGELEQLNALYDVADDESMMEAIETTAGAIMAEFEDKAAALMMIHRNMEAEAEMVEAEVARLKDRADRIRKRTESLRQYLKVNMAKSGIDKIEHDLFTITLRKSSKKVEVLSVDDVPDEYINVKTVLTVDKREALKDLKSGKEIPGLALTDTERALIIK